MARPHIANKATQRRKRAHGAGEKTYGFEIAAASPCESGEPTDKSFVMIHMCTRVRHVALAALTVAALCADRSNAGPGAVHEQQNRSHKFGPGECGPVDPTYVHVANETGGQPFFLNPSEVAKAFHYVRESGFDRQMLFWMTGSFEASSSQEFSVPIDATTRRVTFSLSVDTSGSDLTVVDPAGNLVAAEDSRTEITVLNCGRIVTIDAPAPGIWRLLVNGVGRFWLTTHGRSDLSFVSAQFVQAGGRPGHEGVFRIPGQPLAGVPATLRAVLGRTTARTVLFDLVSPQGHAIQSIAAAAEPTYAGAEPDEFTATFDLPAQPFRVRATGIDEAGKAYQRVFPALFHSETVEVTAPDTADDLVPGTSTALTFAVRNVGSAATFRVKAANGRQFASRVNPPTLALESGATGHVAVWISVPADAAAGTGADVTVTATAESGPPTTNSAYIHVSVPTTRRP